MKRPRSNNYKDKNRSETIPLRIKEDRKIFKGKSKDFAEVLTSKAIENNFKEDFIAKSLTDTHAKPSTKSVFD